MDTFVSRSYSQSLDMLMHQVEGEKWREVARALPGNLDIEMPLCCRQPSGSLMQLRIVADRVGFTCGWAMPSVVDLRRAADSPPGWCSIG
eukprot:6468311-Amphidinium_carterae.3